jgi:hypothetical protein
VVKAQTTIPSDYHWTNPKTGQAYVTRIKRCSGCGGASWGPTGRHEEDGGCAIWGCLSCAT